MTLPLHTFPSRAALMSAAADRLEAALNAGIETRGEACAVLSGGSTPEPAYRELAERAVDWAWVTFGLVDERFVPRDSADSNEGMLLRALSWPLSKGAILQPMWFPSATPKQAADHADANYRDLKLDIAVMGMGADAHTASWFPHTHGLREALDPQSNRSVVALNAPNAAGSADRLSITLAAIARANVVVLLITGDEKRARLEAAVNEPPEDAPVAALLAACAGKIEVLWAA